ncbi:hypothetical protein V1514DRAFT_335996 [Lipomyces japonicus]|uniref:uncharacterized protein n=1 Tax=Lipomyces japonicus TaxID=56871 RepID=UPI0034D01D57
MSKRTAAPVQDAISSKRSRAEGEEDLVDENTLLETDIAGAVPKPSRRNKLRIEGYESDSSEDEFFSSARKARSKTEVQDDQDDDENMFGDDGDNNDDDDNKAAEDDVSSDEDDIDGVSKRSKKVRFLNIDEIEGQEFNSGSVDTESLNREVENFVAGKIKSRMEIDNVEDGVDENMTEDIDPEIGQTGSRLHAPQLEAFNMRSDLEEGKFDANGNFVREKEEEQEQRAEERYDAWLDGLSKKEIRAAAQADELRRQKELQAELESARDDESRPASVLMAQLLSVLETTETPMEALQRLGPGKKTKKWGNKNRRKNEEKVETEEEKEKEKIRKQKVELITDAADKLLSRGVGEIYELPKEQIARMYTRDTGDIWS